MSGKHRKEKWEERRVRMERDRTAFTKIRTQKEWDVVERGRSLFTLQDLWRPAYAVWHGSHRLLAGGSNIISSLSARCAVKCPAKKRARVQNTNKIHWPFPQQLLCSSESRHRKASLSSHWGLCLPVTPNTRSRHDFPITFSMLSVGKKGFSIIHSDLWGRSQDFRAKK